MVDIRNILVCVDSSQYSIATMKYSAYIAKHINADIEALHIIDILQLEGPFMYDLSGALGLESFSNFSNEMKKILEEKGKNVFSSFEEIANAEGVKLKEKMPLGVVSPTIIDESEDFDMVFIGKKGVNASYERGILGSNIEPVVRKIEKPLFVANEHFYTPRNIVVGYDNSRVSSTALKYALYYKSKFNVNITAVYVGKNEEKSKEIFADLDSSINTLFINSEKTADALIDFTKEQDNPLLFLGAYSKHRLLEMIIGSTTESILRKNSNFPILVVR